MNRVRLPHWPARMDVRLASAYLGISRTKLLRQVDAGEKPAPVKDGGNTLWLKTDLDAWLTEQHGLDSGDNPLLTAVNADNPHETR